MDGARPSWAARCRKAAAPYHGIRRVAEAAGIFPSVPEPRLSGIPRVRFAPSPTGYLHVGGARTALFNWLYARQRGGTFILRMEDTDDARNTEASRRTIFDGLRWLGLDPDEGPEQGGPAGPYSQSERGEIYSRAAGELARSGAVYPCFCSKERLREVRERQEREKLPYGYDRRCRGLDEEGRKGFAAQGIEPTWRLRVPEGATVVDDLIRGEITVDNREIEDSILVRADGTPVYNMAVVIDDHHMGITLVMRGEDHLTNTFKQVLIARMLGWQVPEYAHLPLILGPSGEGKLSKRKHPEAALEHYIHAGYHPEAVVNWLARLGWSLDDKTEIMSREELIRSFSIDRIGKGGARLNLDKLEAFSGHYIRQMPAAEFAAEAGARLLDAGLASGDGLPPERLALLASLVQPRVAAFGRIPEALEWALRPLRGYDPKSERNLLKDPGNADLLESYRDSLPPHFGIPAEIETDARSFAESRGVGFGKLVHPVRAAVTGRAEGPPLFDCLAALGPGECRLRLEQAARWIRSRSR